LSTNNKTNKYMSIWKTKPLSVLHDDQSPKRLKNTVLIRLSLALGLKSGQLFSLTGLHAGHAGPAVTLSLY
jgi:APA family basic amino acid/polyamine antiporter